MGELGRAERAFSAAAKARYQGFAKLLEPGGSTPMYQPIVQFRTGELVGYEALTARSQDTYIAVNASPGLLYRPALLEVLSELPPERVVVEITEQHQFESYVQLRETVHLVHERGMRVAVDDTGSGFASLQRLVDVRPETVKLDRGLTAQIDTDAPQRALVAAIRQFADDMGITVVAEGIEREEQLVVLREIGVDCGQGYLLGRPAPLLAGR
jgi:EAL domain-containing protein (putative c-di-GMP-specific phosphodiesterase class I)